MHEKTIAELRAMLTSGELSSMELTQYFLDRIQSFSTHLNAMVSVDVKGALDAAIAADEKIASGSGGPLCGIPLVHKDIYCMEGVRTTCGSRMLDNFISPYDATVVSKLKDAGMVCLGKSNMDEFAMGSSNESSYYGPVKNPWNTEYVPGGSSGGSAAAVAAGLAPLATGTDTGGSIRQPAAFCGVTGIKPTYGRVSRFGMIAFASSLDQGGPIARSAEDCAALLQAMAGFDEKDSTSIDRPVEDYSKGLNDSIEGLRIGVPREYFSEGLQPEVAQAVNTAIDELKKQGAIISDISLPKQGLGIAAYYVVAPAECSSNLSRFDGVRFGYRCEDPVDLEDLYKRSRGEGFGDEVKRRIMVGTYALSAGYYDAYYLKAQKIRRLISDEFSQAFESVDMIAGPTAPSTAFKLGSNTDDPVAMYLNDIYTITANLAGLPGISLPCGFSQGMPVGLQLISNYFTEARLLNVAHRYQQVTDWHRQTPNEFK